MKFSPIVALLGGILFLLPRKPARASVEQARAPRAVAPSRKVTPEATKTARAEHDVTTQVVRPRPASPPAAAPAPSSLPAAKPAAPPKPVYVNRDKDKVLISRQTGKERVGNEQPVGTKLLLFVGKPNSMLNGEIWVEVTKVDYNVFNAYLSQYEGKVLTREPWLPESIIGKTIKFRQDEIWIVESDKFPFQG